jgi:signal peptidase
VSFADQTMKTTTVPIRVEQIGTEPKPAGLKLVKPLPVESKATEPMSVESRPVELKLVEPLSAEPEPVEPEPVESAPVMWAEDGPDPIPSVWMEEEPKPAVSIPSARMEDAPALAVPVAAMWTEDAPVPAVPMNESQGPAVWPAVPKSAMPKPVAPEVAEPEPATLEVVAPESATLEAVAPEPATLEVVAPESTAPEAMPPKPAVDSQRRKSVAAKLSSVIFYTVIVSMLLLALVAGGRGDAPKSLLKFSIFTVLTRSMQSEIPQYSFIVTHETDPKTLEPGDDITYLLQDGRTITHRIIAAYDDYQSTGEVAFETQGIENPAPDAEIVYGRNVVGKVIFHNLIIGKGLRFVSLYWMYLLIPAVIIIVGLFIVMRMYGRRERENT